MGLPPALDPASSTTDCREQGWPAVQIRDAGEARRKVESLTSISKANRFGKNDAGIQASTAIPTARRRPALIDQRPHPELYPLGNLQSLRNLTQLNPKIPLELRARLRRGNCSGDGSPLN